MVCILIFYALIYTGCTTTPLLVQDSTYPALIAQAAGRDFPPEYSEPYYKITFLAYRPGTLIDGKKSLGGHASVSIERSGVFGFYPSKPGKFATKRGILKFSIDYPATQDYTDFLVDKNTKDKILELIAEWENNPPRFTLLSNDCVSFIYRVCDIVGLKYHPFRFLPTNAVRDIGKLNDHYRVYNRVVQ